MPISFIRLLLSKKPVFRYYHLMDFSSRFAQKLVNYLFICDRPWENRPSSHLGMIVEIPVLKIVISITSFYSR